MRTKRESIAKIGVTGKTVRTFYIYSKPNFVIVFSNERKIGIIILVRCQNNFIVVFVSKPEQLGKQMNFKNL